MIIRAKFASTCTKCQGWVQFDEEVTWVPGQKGVTHVKCPVSPVTPNFSPKVTEAPFSTQELWPISTRAALPDPRGQIRRLTKDAVTIRQGKPSSVERPSHGIYVVVGQVARYVPRNSRNFEDGQRFGWILTLYLRSATEESRSTSV